MLLKLSEAQRFKYMTDFRLNKDKKYIRKRRFEKG